MRRLLLFLVLAAVALGWFALREARDPGDARATLASAGPSLQAQLRYVGRDGASGMSARVDDRYIAEVDESYVNYGKVETVAIPPPPVTDRDVSRLVIPSLGINANVDRYGVDRFGRLDVPSDASTIGWHPAYSGMPGDGDSSFFAAHVSWAGGPGVFANLSTLQPGAEIQVVDSTGAIARYTVTSVVDYPLATIDMGALLDGRPGIEGIVLMTCSGPPNEGEYPLRTVVLAVRNGL